MSIARPVTRTIISTTAFGIPVADAINGLMVPSGQRIPIAGATIPGTTTSVLFDRSYTCGPNVKGVMAVVNCGTTTTGAGDLLLRTAGSGGTIMGNAAVPALSGASVTCIGLFPVASGAVRISVSLYAWSASTVTVDGTKSNLILWPVGNVLDQNAAAIP